MTSATRRYRSLLGQLLYARTRALHDDEDRILDEMDAVWSELRATERQAMNHLSAIVSRGELRADSLAALDWQPVLPTSVVGSAKQGPLSEALPDGVALRYSTGSSAPLVSPSFVPGGPLAAGHTFRPAAQAATHLTLETAARPPNTGWLDRGEPPVFTQLITATASRDAPGQMVIV
jgi:hypothetical protein